MVRVRTLLGVVAGLGWILAGAALGQTAVQSGADPSKRQIGQLVLDGIPEVSDSVRQRMMQYLEVRPHSLASISDDGATLLVSTRFGNTNQLHLVKQPLGMRKQITFFDEPTGGRFIPGSGTRFVLFSKDKGGDEKSQYYLMDMESGSWKLLTDGKSRHAGPSISRNGKWMAFTGTARNEKDFDLYLSDLQQAKGAASTKDAAIAKPEMIWQVEGQYYAGEFSPDESKLLVQQYLSERETRWFVVDLESKKQTPITPDAPAAYYGSATWSNNGESVFITSDRDGEFRKLYALKFGYGEWKCITPDLEWDVEDVAVDPAGKGIAFIVNEDGYSRVYFADANGNGAKRIDNIPSGVIGGIGFATKGGVAAFSVNSSTTPSDVYTITFPDAKLTRWTESEVGGLNAATFVEPSLIRYPTFDQVNGKPRTIPAFYYKGRGTGRRPVVISVHGGPEAQFQPTFSSGFQYWVNELGISVIAPNVRGSTGYGRTFHQLDNDVRREDSVKDIGALLDWIEKQPDLDPSRVAIMGGSYGGYMVLGSLTNYPDRFKAGIDVVGIASFISFLKTTPEYRRDLRRAEYGDERKPEVASVLEKISPLNNAEKIRAALFVAHGKNDPRVPFTEAEQIVAKVRGLGRPVWYALALDEGHGFAKKANRDMATMLYAMFWEEHLLK